MSTEIDIVNKKRKLRRKVSAITSQELESARGPGLEDGVILDSQYLLISALVPPAVKAFLFQCEAEFELICVRRDARGEALLSI